MGFTFVSPLSTQTGSRQSQVVTATNAAVTTSTGTITAGAVIAVRFEIGGE